jgi:hypothetical protein
MKAPSHNKNGREKTKTVYNKRNAEETGRTWELFSIRV